MPVESEDGSVLSSYDPTSVRPTSSGPPPLSFAPEAIQEPQPGADANAMAVPFDPRYVEPFSGLMYLGALTKTFSFVGHTFSIRTLRQDEHLACALLIKEYQGTVGEMKAYATAVVAMAVSTVDGKELVIPFAESPDPYGWAFQRFEYIRKNWFPFAIDKVYTEFLDLEQKVQEVIDEMGKALGETGSTPGLKASSV